MDKLVISSYNCHGFNVSKIPAITELTNFSDVILLQETWLLKNQLDIFKNYFPEYNNFSVSSVDSTVLSSGRPYGGLTVLYKLSNRTFYT